MPAYHVIPGHTPCRFITCALKAEGVPHYHHYVLGETKTVVAAHAALPPEVK